jgi:HK97 family phage major capsid protein
VPVAGGDSTTVAWAGRLVTPDSRYTGDFLEYLKARTVYDQLPLRQVPANVTIKGQDGIGTGYWVGESLAIPASAQEFSTINLSPMKVAALAVLSNELIRDSSPSAEMLVRDGLIEAIAQRIDETFLGLDDAGTGTPAGLLFGVTAMDPSGTTAEALRRDIHALYTPFLQARNAAGLHMVTSPTLAKSISLMTNPLGQTEFPGITADGGTLLGDPLHTGDNVYCESDGTHFILMKPSDIWKIGDMGIEVALSRDATIEQVSNPAGRSDNPTAQANTPVSMFQTDSVAFRVIRPIGWAKRRDDAVQFIKGGDYGAAGSE